MSDSLREQVRRRANYRCEYCLVPEMADPLPFQVEGQATVDCLGINLPHRIAYRRSLLREGVNFDWSHWTR